MSLETPDPPAHATQVRFAAAPLELDDRHDDSNEPIPSDAVLRESQLADAAVPDGGFGWVIASACAVMTWWFVGITYCWGIIQSALVAQGLSTPATLSYVGSLAVTFVSILAPASAGVIARAGARNTAILGVFLLGLGNILSGFATSSVGGLFATNGIVMGFGVALSFMVCSTTPAQYFYRKRGLANGIVFAGGGLGGAVISFIMDELIIKLGIPWTFRVIGLMTLATGLPAAWLIRERVPVRSQSRIEWRLFRDPQFVILFAAGAVGTFPLFVPPFFLPLYVNSLGLSSSTAAGLLAGFNFASAIGRIGCGALCDALGALNTLFASLFICALSMLIIWPASHSLAPLAAFVVINGLSNGGFFATMPTVVGNIFGSARLSVAMGMIVTGWAGGYLMGAPIAGFLLNAYGGENRGLNPYRPAMYYAGAMALASALLVLIARMRFSVKLIKKL
ncbi:hypothetical protein PFICI_14568 [Pestalotiopsis fici W106-1]|uniref:Major facilitator superfamily (MFS) profile domain-containing protein n=1 Tax=Pestalotiopsis fici (strain W106-1 / CGMCC3.15140) TaxID=1229662 RepID=W3WKC8_PESFW|nr:uncharacterized protein PFICI_14568 [Pestalotiopsis fici W106-1]ETS73622.1 hypothetical protein PFICI_14568 [Pestalotiopsis fici W106-1]